MGFRSSALVCSDRLSPPTPQPRLALIPKVHSKRREILLSGKGDRR